MLQMAKKVVRALGSSLLICHDKDIECDFKLSIRPLLTHRVYVASSLLASILAVSLYWDIRSELNGGRENGGLCENAYTWSLQDPRNFYFSSQLAVICILVFYVMLVVAARRLHVNIDFEAISTVIAMALMAALPLWTSDYFVTSISAGKFDHRIAALDWCVPNSQLLDQELSKLAMFLDGFLLAFAMYFPIRAIYFVWIPCLAILVWVTTHALLMIFASASLATGSVPFFNLCFTLVFAVTAQRLNESTLRANRLAVKDSEEARAEVAKQSNQLIEYSALINGMRNVAESLCDLVIPLDSNFVILRNHERSWGRCLDIMCGRTVTGCSFTDILAEVDRPRFLEAAQQALSLQLPACLVVTLHLAPSREMDAKLMIVHSGSANVSFLIGLLFEKEERIKGKSQDCQIKDKTQNHHDALRGVIIDHTAASANKDDESSICVLTDASAPTSVAFANEESGDLDLWRRRLDSIRKVGQKENWLMGSENVEVSAHHILGSGGFGVVLKGRLHGIDIAVKIFRSASSQYFDSLTNELRVLRYVRHPNIVQFHGACIDSINGDLAIVTELASGVDLHKFGQTYGDELSLSVRRKVLLSICSALWYLHDMKPAVVHGDLKPRNIMVVDTTLEPTVKLLDFGLSRLLTKSAKPLGGTVRWMAPELLQEHVPAPSTCADIYAYGLISYFVITGVKPFSSFDSDQIKQLLMEKRVELSVDLQDCPLSLECFSLWRKCCHRPWNERPRAKEVYSEVEQWLPAATREGPMVPLSMAFEELRRQSERESPARVEAMFEVFCMTPKLQHVTEGWSNLFGGRCGKGSFLSDAIGDHAADIVHTSMQHSVNHILHLGMDGSPQARATQEWRLACSNESGETMVATTRLTLPTESSLNCDDRCLATLHVYDVNKLTQL